LDRVIRIGTRDSQLALWQAQKVVCKLEALGYKTTLVKVKSTGDLQLDKPLYELGVTGVFTKTLDIAMLKQQVDIAVHSMKDVPTQLPKGIVEAAVLARANTADVFLSNPNTPFSNTGTTIATGSLRRKAQWLHKYPEYNTVDLRGNVNLRLQKLEHSTWKGAIFAAAGLERLELLPSNAEVLDWMLPAPAQGAMLVVAMEQDTYCLEALQKLNDKKTQLCVAIEREFLRTLEGGCTAPIGALAICKEDTLCFRGALFALDGSQKIEVSKEVPLNKVQGLGITLAKELLENGGALLMDTIKKQMQKSADSK